MTDSEAKSTLDQLRELSTKLTETESQLSLFFNYAPVLFIVADHHSFKFSKVNYEWTRRLGWTVTEMCAKPWLWFVHPDDIERTKNAASIMAANKDLKYFYNRYRCKDGTYRTLRWIVTRFIADAAYGLAEDMTGTLEELS